MEPKVFHIKWDKSQQVASRSQILSVEMALNLHSTEHQQTSASRVKTESRLL